MLPYVARVYFDAKAKDGSDAYFEILKDGKRVYVQKAKEKGREILSSARCTRTIADAAMVKMGMDVTGDGQPDLVISEWLGGANCCLLFHIFEIGPTFKKLGTIDAAFGDSGPHFIASWQGLENARRSRSRFTTGPLPTGIPTSPTRPRQKSSCASATTHTASRPT